MMLTKQGFLLEILSCLNGDSQFSALQRYVFQYFEAEEDFELEEALDQIFQVFLPYLHFEESQEDAERDVRLRRVYALLQNATSAIKERVVFGLEFDRILRLTRKLNSGVIPEHVYDEQLAALAPCEYDHDAIKAWAKRHVNEKEPIRNKLGLGGN